MNDRLSLRELIREDIKRYIDSPEPGVFDVIRTCYYEEALVFGILFRISQAVLRIRNPLIRLPLKIVFIWIFYRFLSVLLGIYLDLDARVGKGFYIGHYGAIFIGPVEIGDYCNISQEVTIGVGRMGTAKEGRPRIGNRVYIAPGAKIFGNIKIGDNVSIGANSVVSKDIPDNAVVVGNPGRIVGYQDENISIHNAPKRV